MSVGIDETGSDYPTLGVDLVVGTEGWSIFPSSRKRNLVMFDVDFAVFDQSDIGHFRFVSTSGWATHRDELTDVPNGNFHELARTPDANSSRHAAHAIAVQELISSSGSSSTMSIARTFLFIPAIRAA